MPMLYALSINGRWLVVFGSNWRKEPAAALRGLAKVFSPCSKARSFKRSNPSCGINTSPRTSKRAGGLSVSSCKGMLRMVRMFCVMSSPVVPSPRVAAWVSTPFTYKILTANPSNLGSQQNVNGSGTSPKRS